MSILVEKTVKKNSPSLRGHLLATPLFLLSACSPTTFFYYPNRVMYVDPSEFGVQFQILTYPSLNGKNLKALLFETQEKPKGTVVHFHGNFANVSNHLTQSYYLTRRGFDVLIFDYQGYGGSEGRPNPKNTVEDGIASVRYAAAHLRNPQGGVFLLGQSLGAAVATVVAAREPAVKAVVLEAGFTSYRSIARRAAARSIFLWPAWPIYPFLLPKEHDPERYIAKISPKPLLIIHGDRDRIIPAAMSRRLFERALEPKTLYIVEGAPHLGCRYVAGETYERKVADFFEAALAP